MIYGLSLSPHPRTIESFRASRFRVLREDGVLMAVCQGEADAIRLARVLGPTFTVSDTK